MAIAHCQQAPGTTAQVGPASQAGEAVTASCTLPGVLSSAAAARQLTRQVLQDAGLPAIDEAELCASELAANAVEHTMSGRPGGTFTIEVTASAAVVRIGVRDAGTADGGAPVAPAQRPPLAAESGRGLWLVTMLAARLELTPGSAWCELELPEED